MRLLGDSLEWCFIEFKDFKNEHLAFSRTSSAFCTFLLVFSNQGS